MRIGALGLMVLAGCAIGAGCAKPQIADPTPVLASQSDLARVRQAILPCLRKAWNASGKGQGGRVTLKWRLYEDGKLVDAPEVIDSEVGPHAPAAQAAIQAVYACEPFKLPRDRYDVWKEIVLNFDRTTMGN
jgi:hypothetical protein